MVRQSKKLFVLALALMSGVSARAQWTETTYQLIRTDHAGVYLSHWDSSVTQVYEWFIIFPCHFKVTGSSTQEPAWRQLFASLCDNSWNDSAVFSVEVPAGKRVTNKADYYDREGTNAFERANPTDAASRSLDEHVSDDLYYTLSDIVGSGGSGGAA